MGCPIQISTDQRLLAAPHGFSQRATSFIASWCQGIHRMPFFCSISTFDPEGGSKASPCTGTKYRTVVRPIQSGPAHIILKLSIHSRHPPGITTEKTTATCLNVVADDRWQYSPITRSLYRSDRPRSFSAPKHASEPDLQFIKNTSPPGRNLTGTHAI